MSAIYKPSENLRYPTWYTWVRGTYGARMEYTYTVRAVYTVYCTYSVKGNAGWSLELVLSHFTCIALKQQFDGVFPLFFQRS